MKTDRAVSLHETPAHIDVVAGCAISLVESADIDECAAAESHIAAGNVLGQRVGQKHVDRSPGCVRHAIGNRAIPRWRNVGPPYADMAGGEKGVSEVLQPVLIRICVIIDVRDDLSRGLLPARVARRAQAAVPGAEQTHAVLARDPGRRVCRAIVHDDDFEIRIIDALQCLEGVSYRARTVVAAYDDRDSRPRHVPGKGNLCISGLDFAEGRLRLPIASREPKVPILDVVAAAVPLVGPGKNDRTRASRGESRAQLPCETLGLGRLSIAAAVEAYLCQQERALTRDVLE